MNNCVKGIYFFGSTPSQLTTTQMATTYFILTPEHTEHNNMRFDLHVHSTHSRDSISTIDDIIHRAEATGLAGIAICDHNTTAGSLLAIQRAKELHTKIHIIPGTEVSTTQGHLLVLGITEDLKPGQTPEQTIKAAQQHDAITIAAHPFKKPKSLGCIQHLDIDAIETMNSRCRIWCSNHKARKMAELLHLPQVGGSDSHTPEMIGLAYTEIKTSNKQNILEAIRERNTKPGGRLTPLHIMFKQACRGIMKKTIH